MPHKTASKINVVACDLGGLTGEASLAQSLIDGLTRSGFVLNVYSPNDKNRIFKAAIFKRRFVHLYGFFVALFLTVFSSRKTVYLNYTPLWNPLVALLCRFGVTLGPITGSIGILPVEPTFGDRFLRGVFQRVLVWISLRVLPRDRYYWAATPSVFRAMESDGYKNLNFGFPFYLNVEGSLELTASVRGHHDRNVDFFIYSKKHPLKNWDATCRIAENLCELGHSVAFVGCVDFEHTKLFNLNQVGVGHFAKLIAGAECFLSLTSEDAGIACMTADYYQKPIIYLENSAAKEIADPIRSAAVRYHRNAADSAMQIACIFDRLTARSDNSNNQYKLNVARSQLAYARWMDGLA